MISTTEDPVTLLVQELAQHPSDVERAAQYLEKVQSDLRRVLFSAPHIRGVEIVWPPPDSYHHATLRIAYKVDGKFGRKWLEFRADGRDMTRIRLNGSWVPADNAVTVATKMVADSIAGQ